MAMQDDKVARLRATIERLYEDLRRSRATIRALATVATIVECEVCGRQFATRVTKPKRYCSVRCTGRAVRAEKKGLR